MKRSLFAIALGFAMLFVANPASAQSAMSAATPSAMKGGAMSSSMSSMKMTPAGNHTCKAPMKYVKGYTKKDGTKVKGYCRKA